MDYQQIKAKFRLHFNLELEHNPKLKILLYEVFIYGSAYIVGGYLRDFLNDKESRDLDILVEINNEKLYEIINNSDVNHSINRHGGIKLYFEKITVDIWSFENNWAFRNNLVKLNENDKLTSIAKGCFYNYDSLVINLHTYNFSLHNYNNFISERTLDILYKSPLYKNLNPTKEANILRAFYLKKKYDIKYTLNTKSYLKQVIAEMRDNGLDVVRTLDNTINKYPKYEHLLFREDIVYYTTQLYKGNELDIQNYIDF